MNEDSILSFSMMELGMFVPSLWPGMCSCVRCKPGTSATTDNFRNDAKLYTLAANPCYSELDPDY